MSRSSANFYGLHGLSIAVLHSAVRGIHVYRRKPAVGTLLKLESDDKSKYKNSVGVYEGTNIVGHIAREHSRLVLHWLKHSNYKV